MRIVGGTPTKEQLLWLFDYDRENGVLIWKNHWGHNTAQKMRGKIAGNIRREPHTNYKYLMLQFKTYQVHRLIFFIETGTWPQVVDHIDGNGLNNRFDNLRASTWKQNSQNLKFHRRLAAAR